MNLLIVDDDNLKIEEFTNYLKPIDCFRTKHSYNSGVNELIENRDKYDALILDMNFPKFDDGVVSVNMGIEVLKELKRRDINIPVVIFSSKYVKTTEYDNILDYILYDGMCNMECRIESLREKLISHNT